MIQSLDRISVHKMFDFSWWLFLAFWVMAAKCEFEDSKNVSAARFVQYLRQCRNIVCLFNGIYVRSLLQRGLRMNCESKLLWLEVCRLVCYWGLISFVCFVKRFFICLLIYMIVFSILEWNCCMLTRYDIIFQVVL